MELRRSTRKHKQRLDKVDSILVEKDLADSIIKEASVAEIISGKATKAAVEDGIKTILTPWFSVGPATMAASATVGTYEYLKGTVLAAWTDAKAEVAADFAAEFYRLDPPPGSLMVIITPPEGCTQLPEVVIKVPEGEKDPTLQLQYNPEHKVPPVSLQRAKPAPQAITDDFSDIPPLK